MKLSPTLLLFAVMFMAPPGAYGDWNFPDGEDPNQPAYPDVPSVPQIPPGRPVRPRPTPAPQRPQQPQPTPPPQPQTKPPAQPQPDVANPPGVIFTSPCPQCQIIQQYNPVCGTNGVTYASMEVLNCHRVCGVDVNFRKMGTCGANRT